MRKLTAVLMVAGLGFGAADVTAQTATGNASVTIPTVLVVSSVTNLTLAGTTFDFSAGETATSEGSVTIVTRSNVAHAVDVTGTAIANGGVALDFSVEDANATYQPVGSTAVKALANLGMGTQTNTISFQAGADVNTHAPGEYTGTITYTVLANY